jgi:hypothetical protein
MGWFDALGGHCRIGLLRMFIGGDTAEARF